MLDGDKRPRQCAMRAGSGSETTAPFFRMPMASTWQTFHTASLSTPPRADLPIVPVNRGSRPLSSFESETNATGNWPVTNASYISGTVGLSPWSADAKHQCAGALSAHTRVRPDS